MNFRQNGTGRGAALTLASICLTLTAPALAQDPYAAEDSYDAAVAPEEEASAETEAPSDSTLDASLGGELSTDTGAEADASAEVTEPEAEPEPEPEPAAEEEPAAEDEGEDEAIKTDKKDDQAADPEDPGGWGVKQLKVVQTPWTAYPSQYVRGITYGSLWRTFHGQQWPYMPADEKNDDPAIQIGFSGYVWNDLSYTHVSVDERLLETNVGDQTRFVSQTRGVLRMTPTYNVGGGWFVQGNGEFVVQGDMRPDVRTGILANTDDVWVRFGKWNLFDLTFGRFQGWEIANHYGMALDWATLERQGAWVSTAPVKPTDGYGLDYFWDRQNFQLGGYALHLYPTKWLRGELLGHFGAGSSGAANPRQIDVRPSLIFDIGFLKIKAGYEYGKGTPQDKRLEQRESKNGFGAAAQVVLAPYVEFGGSFARGYTDVLDSDGLVDLAGSNTTQSLGGFINISPGWEPLVIGGGAFLKSWKEMRINRDGGEHDGERYSNDQWLLFGAVQYTLWKQLYLKAVVSHASNKGVDQKYGAFINNALSGRFRAEFLF